MLESNPLSSPQLQLPPLSDDEEDNPWQDGLYIIDWNGDPVIDNFPWDDPPTQWRDIIPEWS